MGSSLIVCIGNDLVADDAVGHALYRCLTEESLGNEIRLCLLGVGGMAVVDELLPIARQNFRRRYDLVFL